MDRDLAMRKALESKSVPFPMSWLDDHHVWAILTDPNDARKWLG